MIDKLVIGTANFGMHYGYRENKLSKSEAFSIIDLCEKSGINLFDTASVYGNSESILQSKLKPNRLISKLVLKEGIDCHIENYIKERKGYYAILVHNPEILNDQYKANKFIETIKNYSSSLKAGISIYTESEFELAVLNGFEIVQCPYNVLDRRFDKIIESSNIEVHVRSIFLQGLLLSKNTNSIIKKCPELLPYRSKLDLAASSMKISNLEYCLRYVFSNENIDKFIVGISSKSQLEKIINIIKSKNTSSLLPIKCDQVKCLDPRTWNE